MLLVTKRGHRVCVTFYLGILQYVILMDILYLDTSGYAPRGFKWYFLYFSIFQIFLCCVEQLRKIEKSKNNFDFM